MKILSIILLFASFGFGQSTQPIDYGPQIKTLSQQMSQYGDQVTLNFNALIQANQSLTLQQSQISDYKINLATANLQIQDLQSQLAALQNSLTTYVHVGTDPSIINNASDHQIFIFDPGVYKPSKPILTKNYVTIVAKIVVTAAVVPALKYPLDLSINHSISGPNVIFDGSGLPVVLTLGLGNKLQGITVDKCANPWQRGAVLVSGDSCDVEDVIVQNTNSSGIEIYGNHSVIQRVGLQHNGQEGYCGHPQNSTISIYSMYNNDGRATDLWDKDPTHPSNGVQVAGKWYVKPGGEAGGGKFSSSNGLTMDHSYFEGNGGINCWMDYANVNYVIQNTASVNAKVITAAFDPAAFMDEINHGPAGNGKYINCFSGGKGSQGFVFAETAGAQAINCTITDMAYFRNNKINPPDTLGGPPPAGNGTGFRNGGCQDDAFLNCSVYSPAQIYYTDKFDPTYITNRHITISGNMAKTGTPTWNPNP